MSGRQTMQIHQDQPHDPDCAFGASTENPWVIDIDHPITRIKGGAGTPIVCVRMRCNDPDCSAAVCIPDRVLSELASAS